MFKTSASIVLLALTLSSGAASHQASGPLKVLPMGIYECSLPGSAAGKAWQVIEGSTFKIASASRYLSDKGNGTYLLAGDRLIFTRGPMHGMRFTRTSASVLYQIDEKGQRQRMRCALSSRR